VLDETIPGMGAQMKTGIGNMVLVLLFACLAFVVAAFVQTTTRTGTKGAVEAPLSKGRTISTDHSNQMVAGATTMPEAVRIMQDGKDSPKARQLITDAQTMRYGVMRAEAMLTERPKHVVEAARKITLGSETENGQ
jgi:hypothetical protein